MKKRLIKLLALVLAICLLPAVPAFAATYDVTVTISDAASPAGPKANKTFTDGLNIQSEDAKLSELLAQITLANYEDLRQFGSPAMKARMDEGLAIAGTGGTHLASAWTTYAGYIFDCGSDTALHDKLANYNTTIGDLGPGTYVVKHLNNVAGDPKENVTYTVTIVIAEHTTGGGGGGGGKPQTDDKNVFVTNNPTPTTEEGSKETGGATTVDTEHAANGQIVKITTHPEEGNMVGRITVQTADGEFVTFSYDGNGVYEFTMPAGTTAKVTVTYRVEPADPQDTGVSELLDTANHKHYMIGDDLGFFNPTNPIKRCEVAQMFYNLLLDKPEYSGTSNYSDVKDNAWYAKAVNALTDIGILSGMGDGTFEPERGITRAEFASACARFARVSGQGRSFTDVPESHWAYRGVGTAAAFGWVSGMGDGTFEPDRTITREEAATAVNCMLYRLGDQIAIDAGVGRQFPDVNRNMWSWYEIEEAVTDHDYERLDVSAREKWILTTAD